MKPKYCELKRNIWFATLKIPKDVRHWFNKTKFIQTTKTSDAAQAEEIAMGLVSKWKQWIREARANGLNSLSHPYYVELARQQLEEAQTDVEWDSATEGCNALADELRQQGEHEGARIYYELGSGIRETSILSSYKNDWERERLSELSIKNRKQKLTDIEFFFKQFYKVEDVSREAVIEWVRKLLKSKAENGFGLSPSSVARKVSAARDLWLYLHDRAKVTGQEHNLDTPKFLTKAKNNTKKPPRKAFTQSEAVFIHKECLLKGDTTLANLIMLAMYTGARIEEICRLNTQSSNSDWLIIEGSKTKAGIRKVPVHPTLKPMVKELIENSKDGYLISGLKEDKDGKRSTAIGKRFGRLKEKLGFGEEKVFHSFRRTVITMMQEANIQVDVIAATVGHKQESFTLKHYSDAELKEQKIKAINILNYSLN